MAVDAARAQELAFTFLRGDPDRRLHLQAVAAPADELRPAVPVADGSLLGTAAWLHDIGYSPALRETGFRWTEPGTWPEPGIRWPRWWPITPAPGSWPRFGGWSRSWQGSRSSRTLLTDALTYADQTVGPRGERLSVADRLDEAVRRHGPDAPTSLAAPRRDPYIYVAAERTEARL